MSKIVSLDVEPDEVGLDPQRLARIDGHVRQFVDDDGFPGGRW